MLVSGWLLPGFAVEPSKSRPRSSSESADGCVGAEPPEIKRKRVSTESTIDLLVILHKRLGLGECKIP